MNFFLGQAAVSKVDSKRYESIIIVVLQVLAQFYNKKVHQVMLSETEPLFDAQGEKKYPTNIKSELYNFSLSAPPRKGSIMTIV